MLWKNVEMAKKKLGMLACMGGDSRRVFSKVVDDDTAVSVQPP